MGGADSPAADACRGHGQDRAGRQVRAARRRLQVRRRGAPARRLPPRAKVEVELVDSEDLDPEDAGQADGILIPGGFGERGIEGKIEAARVAREREIPFLGICLGMQLAVVDFARHVVGLEGANSAEFDPETPYPVIDLLPEQKEVTDMGGTMRLGADPVKLHDGTRARELYGEAVIYERHRHRYEVNNMLRRRLEDAGPGDAAARRPTSGWSRSSSCPTIRSSSPRSSTPSSSRGRPDPSRCSASSSAPRRSARANGARSAPRPRRAPWRTSTEPADVSARRSGVGRGAVARGDTAASGRRPPIHERTRSIASCGSARSRARPVARAPSPTRCAAELRELGVEVTEDDAAEAARRRIRQPDRPRSRARRWLGHVLRATSTRFPTRGTVEVELDDGVYRSARRHDPRRRQQGRGHRAGRARGAPRRPSRRRSGSSCVFTVAEEDGPARREGARRSTRCARRSASSSTTRSPIGEVIVAAPTY